jgi:hypothetical protein
VNFAPARGDSQIHTGPSSNPHFQKCAACAHINNNWFDFSFLAIFESRRARDFFAQSPRRALLVLRRKKHASTGVRKTKISKRSISFCGVSACGASVAPTSSRPPPPPRNHPERERDVFDLYLIDFLFFHSY